MASITNLLRTFYWSRSDQDFDNPGFEEIMVGEATAKRLEQVMHWRDDGAIPRSQIIDSRYQDLIDDPAKAIGLIYEKLDLPYASADAERIQRYLSFKPKHKHGAHTYRTMSDEQVARNRPHFKRYQERHNVPDEV